MSKRFNRKSEEQRPARSITATGGMKKAMIYSMISDTVQQHIGDGLVLNQSVYL